MLKNKLPKLSCLCVGILIFISANCPLAFAQNLFDAQHYQPLTADQRAHQIGDIITVLILQNSTARSSADLSTNKNMNINAQANANGTQNKVGAGVGVSDNGSGETSRGGNLKAVISVTICGIDSNGNYLIKGEQEMLINGEKQSITLSGSVRSTDISSNNTIYSSQIANANISYTGDGALSAAQRHGIFYRIFSFLGLI
ncbi:flagellar basal body L-ring protein FlgH [Cysteiniphilum sp. QT6929]|uniref:flagellar basal body L-ring protein FlgH n=1 Tax=Cysteiniphilum sp. QT6929 TaxID=2975055 RepID=UPI0024B39CCE|nr:flagellar basal body L-ring protein FlgH [Cysteiniphilum sp. QT6929]WHN66091.1 flagellar basal body L-ring protein FlgH [Cysteiniphilum sp. QT6929]